MTNLFFTSYGIDKEVQQMRHALSNIPFAHKYKNYDANVGPIGQEMTGFVQGILQPIQLWKFSFPEDKLDMVLKTLKFSNISTHHSNLNKYYALLRKILKLKEIPKIDMTQGQFYPLVRQQFPNVNLTAIGYSEDLRTNDENKNEML